MCLAIAGQIVAAPAQRVGYDGSVVAQAYPAQRPQSQQELMAVLKQVACKVRVCEAAESREGRARLDGTKQAPGCRQDDRDRKGAEARSIKTTVFVTHTMSHKSYL